MNNKVPKWIVTSVKVESDFWLLISFADGSLRRYDMKPVIAEGGVFKKIAQESIFSKAYADGTTVSWPGDVDISPEELYYNGIYEAREI